MRRSVTLALLLLVACSREPGAHKADKHPTDASAVVPPARTAAIAAATLRPLAADLQLLSDDDHLVRIALVLAGRRPTDEEFAEVRRDPAAVSGIVDRYLDDPVFGDVVRDMWHEVLLMRVEGRYVLPRYGALPQGTDAEWIRDVSEEPLRLIEHVVMNDRPFGEVVTVDHAIATDLGLQVWGGSKLPADPAAPPPDGWHKVTWDSGQPMAGLLASGALWLRHPSNGTNLHRGRAEMISDAFLCSGFLGRDVPLFNNIDLSDEDVVREALVREPGCVSCHQTLDPLASHVFGFARVGPNTIRKAYDKADPTRCLDEKRGNCYPLHEYRPAQAKQWQKKTGRPPGYFGLPSDDLRSLGRQIAGDPRFSMCVARRFYGYFMQVAPTDIPDPTAAALQDALIAADMKIKPLVKAIVLSDDFRAAGARPDSPASALVGRKTTRPEQLGRLIADLTGFVWTATPGGAGKNGKNKAKLARIGEVSLLATDQFGYRAMAGGVEGIQITEPSFAYSPTRTLVLQTLAAESAAFAVQAGDLLTIADGDTAEPAVRAQLVALHARLLAQTVPASDPAIDAGLALFKAGLGAAQTDTARAWTLVLTALLQDPRIAFH